MVVIDLNTVYAMGLNKKNLIPVGMKIKVANTGGLKLLVGVLVEIRGLDMNGIQRSSKQLAYVSADVNRIFLSKRASEDLGIIDRNFPMIGAYALSEQPEDSFKNIDVDNKINKFKSCDGSDLINCSCPKENSHPKFQIIAPFLLQ